MLPYGGKETYLRSNAKVLAVRVAFAILGIADVYALRGSPGGSLSKRWKRTLEGSGDALDRFVLTTTICHLLRLLK